MGFIRDLECRWPGSAHDSRVWESSRAKELFEQQEDYSIVGDRDDIFMTVSLQALIWYIARYIDKIQRKFYRQRVTKRQRV